MNRIAFMALWACMGSAVAVKTGPTPPDQIITRAGTRPPTLGPSANFDGSVRVDPLTGANATINATSAYVTFAPGAHSAWHSHPLERALAHPLDDGRVLVRKDTAGARLQSAP